MFSGVGFREPPAVTIRSLNSQSTMTALLPFKNRSQQKMDYRCLGKSLCCPLQSLPCHCPHHACTHGRNKERENAQTSQRPPDVPEVSHQTLVLWQDILLVAYTEICQPKMLKACCSSKALEQHSAEALSVGTRNHCRRNPEHMCPDANTEPNVKHRDASLRLCIIYTVLYNLHTNVSYNKWPAIDTSLGQKLLERLLLHHNISDSSELLATLLLLLQ